MIFIGAIFWGGLAAKAHQIPDTVFSSQRLNQEKINRILKTLSSKDFEQSVDFLLSFKGKTYYGEKIQMSLDFDIIQQHTQKIKTQIQTLLDSMIIYEKASYFYVKTLWENASIPVREKFSFFENYYQKNLYFLDSLHHLLTAEILNPAEHKMIPQYIQKMPNSPQKNRQDWYFYQNFLKTLTEMKKSLKKEKIILQHFKKMYYQTK